MRCNGDGWLSVYYQIDNGNVYDGVVPCSCRNGNEVTATWRKIKADSNVVITRFIKDADEAYAIRTARAQAQSH